MDVYRYTKNQYNNGKISILFSEDFWRKIGRQGREAIDKANEVYQYSLPHSNSKEGSESVIDTNDAVNKFFEGKESNKTKLIGALQINENKLKTYIQRNNVFKERITKRDRRIAELKKEKSTLINKLNEYEEIFFQWLDASSSKDVPLINTITTGKSRNKIVDKLFETMFSDNVLEGYNEFENYRKHADDKRIANDNIVQLKQKNTLIDDLDL